ncbi:MAG: N-acetyl-gamma-glutamyl-phosphate reductase [Planctomycetota bacterium]
MIRAAVYGGTGYGGAELLRLLTLHPDVEIAQVTSRKPGRRVDVVHPTMRGLSTGELVFTESKPDALDPSVDAVFLALPHGESSKVMDAIIARCEHAKIYDLAQDYRTGWEPAGWVYGQPEFFREQIRTARFVALPGCFATAIALATLPMLRAGLGPRRIIVDAKTGSSGSGAHPKSVTHHPTRVSTFKAYKVMEHQHETEIKAAWGKVTTTRDLPSLTFVPQSTPLVRGIYACAYFVFEGEPPLNTRKHYEEAYEGSRFVRVVDSAPNVHHVCGTNNADIFVKDDYGVTLVIAAIDNLVRGASGQAVQCMNLGFGWPEDTGLRLPALQP